MENNRAAFGMLDFVVWDHDWNDHHYPTEALEKGLSLMQEAGVGFLRMDFLWEDLEPVENQWDWKRYDEIVQRVKSHGIELLGILHYSPPWHRKEWNEAPDPQVYARFARTVAAHYQKDVSFWEVWNEPDHPMYWQPQDGMKTYTALLQAAYPAIKQGNPNAKVLMGGLSQALPKSLKQIYELTRDPVSVNREPNKTLLTDRGSRVTDHFPFDIVNIHPFINPFMPDAVGGLQYFYDMVHKTMVAFGDGDKPVWVTEIGCPGVPKPAAEPIADWWLGKNTHEGYQADWVKQVYKTLLTKCPGVEKVFWAFFRDTPNHFKSGVDYFGLVRRDFSKKPAFDAFQKLPSD